MRRLEPDAGKLACPVLRGGSGGNASPLLDNKLDMDSRTESGLEAFDLNGCWFEEWIAEVFVKHGGALDLFRLAPQTFKFLLLRWTARSGYQSSASKQVTCKRGCRLSHHYDF